VAVGRYTPAGGHAHALADIWNGSNWSLSATPGPRRAGQQVIVNVLRLCRAYRCGRRR
jgi:hypothetical protein